MLSKKFTAVAGASEPTDPNFSSVSLLLHGDGTNGAQNNTFLDSSINNFTITRNGNVTQGSFSPYSASAPYSTSTKGGSAYFDGSGDSLATPSITVGTNAFCFECWFYPTTAQTAAAGFFVGTTNGSIQATYYTSSGLGLAERGVAWTVTETTAIPTVGQWNHIAYVRSSTGANQTSIFLNGVRVANGTSSTNYVASAYNVGYNSSDNVYALGYFSDARLTIGSSPYSASSTTITVPTAPLTAITNTSLLLNMTNAGIYDNAMMNDLETVGNAQISTSVKKYGTGSIALDGSGDWLLIPYGPNMALQNTYTVEAWVYPANTSAGYRTMFMIEAAPGTSFGAFSLYQSGTTLGFEVRPTSGGGITSISGGTLTANTWQHVAISVSGTSGKLFLNGTQVGSTTTLPDYSFSVSSCSVGGHPNGTTEGFNGYIDDLRITKGVARYTSNFTAPTAAFPDK